MLRPELYRRLQQLFKHVEIVDENVPGQMRVVTNAFTGKRQLELLSAGEEYRVNCPYCYDTRKRLYFNHRWGLKIPGTDSLNLGLCHCFNENCMRDYDRRRWLYNDLFCDISNGTPETPDVLRVGNQAAPVSRPFAWPGQLMHVHNLTDGQPATRYLRDLGFDPKQLGRDLRVSYCFAADHEFRLATNRIIIPIAFDGKYVGWQARYIGTPPRQEIPKYYTMPGFKKTHYLYNLDRARNYPFVVLCEGVTDVWRVGPTSVALFGKTLSTTQRLLLGTYWSQGAAVVLLDSDAADDAQSIYDSLQGVVAHRVLVRLPKGKDPGDMNRLELDQLILTAGRDQGVDLAAMLKRGPASRQEGVEATVKHDPISQIGSGEAAPAQ